MQRDAFLTGGGEMGERIRAFDWTTTPLGSPHQWPHGLKTAVRIMLTSRQAMWIGWGPELTYLYNDPYKAIIGGKHPTALGQPTAVVWREIWPEIGPRLETVITLNQGTYDEALLLVMERYGYQEETYYTFSYSPIPDDHGGTGGIFCANTDDTERVVRERQLALLRQLAGAAANAHTVEDACELSARSFDADHHDIPFALLYLCDPGQANVTLAATSGIERDHAAAPERHPIDSNHPWPVAAALATGEPAVVAGPFPFELPTGSWDRPPAQVLVIPISLQAQAGHAGVLIVGLNPYRLLNDAYRGFIEVVSGQVAAGIANARAYEEERRRAESLAELDRAKTAFFSNVSHEFRTPLTLILGPLADLAQAPGQLPVAAAEQIALAHRNSLRLLKLVNTLLDFSRIEAGRVQARYEPTDLAAFTRDLASTFRSAMDKAGLEFRVDCPPLPAPVYVDRDMWEKIVLNLLSNAFKFTLEGSVTIALAEREGTVELSVRDTGVGMPGHELPHLFERFHRVEGSGGRSHEGSGIGLALVHELVKMHGGRLVATSQPGEGSTFTATVPLGSAHLAADRIVEATGDTHAPAAAQAYVEEALRWLPGGAGNGDGGQEAAAATTPGSEPFALPGHILLADDNADMREYVRKLLGARWSVEAVSNGREALAAMRARRPDVVVTDVMMPQLDGFGLLREIRGDEASRTIPVIMLSARAGEEAVIEGFRATADDYLAKPFSARELVARVEAQLLNGWMQSVEARQYQRWVEIFRDAPVALAILRGPDHVFEFANPAYLELVGGRHVAGLPLRLALPELDAPENRSLLKMLDTVFASGEPQVIESLRVMMRSRPDADLEERFFKATFHPIRDVQGSVYGIIAVGIEVTELALARRQAESANRLKDEFLATLSHELRTPLNAVLGYTQMLRANVIDEERRGQVLETIERNARTQEQLISDVLDVSRIITGKMRLDVRPVDVAQVIEQAIDTVRPAAEAKGVRIQPVLDRPGAPVAGDAQRLQQVAWNLLSNAVKFTPRGGRVQVRVGRADSHVEVVVSDTGEGIAPEFAPHLFERFRQADGTPSRAHGGLGLGLAISRHIVEAHGGRIAASSPGKGLGTTVTVELPLLIVHGDSIQPAPRTHPTIEIDPIAQLSLADLRGVSVLLVDDDRDALEMARDALAVAGAEVITASSGSETLGLLDRCKIDVLILDIGMPAMDGYELLRQIRHRPAERNGGVPAAALTAYARPGDRTRSLQAGFALHLAKPIQPTELAAAVRRLAEQRPSGPERPEDGPAEGGTPEDEGLPA